jgi:multidrug efflux pump subunit AcrB
MNLIQSSLRKPITVVVAVLAILFFAAVSSTKIAVDIFPALDVPTIYVAQPYGGMAPDQMDGLMATRYQDHFLYVQGIKNIEMKSIQGLSLMKLTFYPGTDMAEATAEVANNVSRARAYMPEGTVPPQVVRFDASSVPVGELVFESDGRTLNELQDFAASRIRPMFSTIPGVSSPPPFGGNQRTIIIRVNPDLLRSYKISPEDVVKVVAATNQPSAAGNVRIGDYTLMTPVNSLIRNPQDFLNVPLKTNAGPVVFLKDIATVQDAADITVGYALVNGKRAVYIPIVKKADASTLAVVNNIKEALPRMREAIPEDVKLHYEFDQSVYVTNQLKNLIGEGVLGALLTGLMVFLFLRDWRSVVIVLVTIPLSILTAVILLNLVGQTINIMTLSGLALAIGVLVDQATVSIENIHQHIEMGKSKAKAILDACLEIAFPELLILLCILAVFAPSFIMEGIPKSMFLPLSLSVGFAMIASYLIAQTMVPVLSNWLMKPHSTPEAPELALDSGEVEQVINEPLAPENTRFDRFKIRYEKMLAKFSRRNKLVIISYGVACLLLIVTGFMLIGNDILPKSNAGQFQVRLRAPEGTRFERTEQFALKALEIIKHEAGDKNVQITSTYVGTQPSSYGTSTIFLFTSGPHEAVLQVALKEDYHVDMAALKDRLRQRWKKAMPTVRVSFEPTELVEKIMSQGSSTPIEVSVTAKDIREAYRFAGGIENEMKKIPSLRDVQIPQPIQYPIIQIDIDRRRAGQMGITAGQIARSMVASTSSSRFTEKNLWVDPKSGLGYQVQVQIPENEISSVNDVSNIPLMIGGRPILSDVASVYRTNAPGEYDREGPNRLVTVTANLNRTDLGRANDAVQKAIERAGTPPRGVSVSLKGQVKLLTETLSSLQRGLLLAVVVIFLLLSANYQSFKVSTVVLSSVPAVIAGSLLALLVWGSTLNLQSYMGMIMSVGVSVANAVLMITTAENLRMKLHDPKTAALLAAKSRIRPILMTSIAMIAGMMPMASGLGEGGDQVAPLGQAVIGGLIASTLASLFILPNVFIALQRRASLRSVSLDPKDPASDLYEI